MEDNKFQRAYNLKLISDEFNNLSDYEKYVKTNKEYLDGIYNNCLKAAKRGSYSTGIFTTFRYNDPTKEYLIKYFKDLYYKVELFEPGFGPGLIKKEPTEEELRVAPYRQYILMLSWNKDE